MNLPDASVRPRPAWARWGSPARNARAVLFLVLAFPAFAHAAKPASDGSGFFPGALEIVRLPKMCWGQFDSKFRGPGFELPGGCGGSMNHLCPTYVSLNRAKSAVADPGARVYWLGVAHGHIEYTINAIKNYPACPLRDEIGRLQGEIRGMQAAKR